MSDTIKISLKSVKKTTKQKAVEIPDDFMEILPKYIEIYHGCWLKYSDNDGNGYSGGFLIDLQGDTVYLRNIKRDIFELNKGDYIFYAKEDTPQHKAVRAIVQERERLSSQVLNFNIQKQKYLRSRRIS